jgi:antirestriction protein ArdC
VAHPQAAELGGQVRKGEKGSLVVYADTFTKTATDDKFTPAESIYHARLVRRIAVIFSALHGDISSALTGDERAWLAA